MTSVIANQRLILIAAFSSIDEIESYILAILLPKKSLLFVESHVSLVEHKGTQPHLYGAYRVEVLFRVFGACVILLL